MATMIMLCPHYGESATHDYFGRYETRGDFDSFILLTSSKFEDGLFANYVVQDNSHRSHDHSWTNVEQDLIINCWYAYDNDGLTLVGQIEGTFSLNGQTITIDDHVYYKTSDNHTYPGSIEF